MGALNLKFLLIWTIVLTGLFAGSRAMTAPVTEPGSKLLVGMVLVVAVRFTRVRRSRA
jgi:hypothetical protein